MKRYKSIYKHFTEELRFSDLKKSAGMSDLTKDFRKERNKVMKPENITAKFIDTKIQGKDVMFEFLTEVTEKYPDGYKWGEVEPDSNFDIKKPNSSKTYEMNLLVLDFFEWLDTTPDKITNKDIEDVLEVANVKLWCNCPSFHWQGMNFIMSTFDASIHPTEIAPKFWNKKHMDDNFLCKHLGGLVNQIKFYIPQMRMGIKAKMGLTKK